MKLIFLMPFILVPVLAQEPASTFRDCADCPDMVVIPAGTFSMGTPPGFFELDESTGESPPIPVTISRAFAMARTETTVAEFRAFVETTGYQIDAGCTGWKDGSWQFDANLSWRDGPDKTPAVCVSWTDAVAYTAWLSDKTGEAYRLPSESQWEYAARAGTSWPRYWGITSFEAISISDACTHANVYDVEAHKTQDFDGPHARCTDRHAGLAPVRSFATSPFGLNDIIGNASEWTADCYTASYWGRPRDERPWLWDGGCETRPIRGGSYASRPNNARVAARADALASSRRYTIGFRVVRDLD